MPFWRKSASAREAEKRAAEASVAAMVAKRDAIEARRLAAREYAERMWGHDRPLTDRDPGDETEELPFAGSPRFVHGPVVAIPHGIRVSGTELRTLSNDADFTATPLGDGQTIRLAVGQGDYYLPLAAARLLGEKLVRAARDAGFPRDEGAA